MTSSQYDDLQKAGEQVKAMFDGNVQILTVTDPQAFETIERIKTKLRGSSADKTLSDDLAQVLRMASK